MAESSISWSGAFLPPALSWAPTFPLCPTPHIPGHPTQAGFLCAVSRPQVSSSQPAIATSQPPALLSQGPVLCPSDKLMYDN